MAIIATCAVSGSAPQWAIADTANAPAINARSSTRRMKMRWNPTDSMNDIATLIRFVWRPLRRLLAIAIVNNRTLLDQWFVMASTPLFQRFESALPHDGGIHRVQISRRMRSKNT